MDHLSLTVLPLESSLDGNEGNMEEIWRKYARLGNCLGEGQVECHFVEFPQRRIFLGVLEMPGAPQKPKRAAATITQLAQKRARSVKN